MGEQEDLLQGLWDRVRRSKGTWGLVILLGLVYLGQLVVARSIQYGAAYTVAQEHVRSHVVVYILFSPLVHSNHGHILWNFFFLAIGGVLVESWVGWKKLLAFVYVIGVASNFLPGWTGFGGYGVGISAANLGLWAFFGLKYCLMCAEEWHEMPREPTRSVVHALPALFGMSYAARGIAQYFGWVSTSPGVAKGAHLLGIVLGVSWFASRFLQLP